MRRGGSVGCCMILDGSLAACAVGRSGSHALHTRLGGIIRLF